MIDCIVVIDSLKNPKNGIKLTVSQIPPLGSKICLTDSEFAALDKATSFKKTVSYQYLSDVEYTRKRVGADPNSRNVEECYMLVLSRHKPQF